MPLTREDIQDIQDELSRERKAAKEEISAWKQEVRNRFDALSSGPGGGPSFRQILAGRKELIERPPIKGAATHVNFDIERKTVTGVSVGVPFWTRDVLPLPTPTPLVRSFIPTVPLAAGAVGVTKKVSFTRAAAPVSEGTAKPQANASYSPVVIPVEKIAVYAKLSDESYNDLPQLVAELETELVWDVLMVEEGQLLKGSGVRPQLVGIYPAAPAAAALTGTPTLLDELGAAVGELANAGFRATGAVVNGSDWNSALLLKATDGNYLLGSPVTMPANRIWSIPVAVSSALSVGEWLVGDWQRGARLYERESVNIRIATESEDDLLRNLVAAVCELREALVTLNIAAFRKNAA